jgi:hypothetical protein
MPGIHQIDEEEYSNRLQIEAKTATLRIKRISILFLTELFLVVGLYFLMAAIPTYALSICLIMLSLMFSAMGFFIWNEITNHHHTKEAGGFHYHIPQGETTSNIIKVND